MDDIFRHRNTVTAEQRESLTGQRGAVLWLTGLSGSGKSTIACEAERILTENGRHAYLLDGDNLRLGLNSDLGFSHADRSENIRRTACTASLFADSSTAAIVSLISPYESDRKKAAEICRAMNVPFVEIFVDTPLEECIRRDTKGLYKKAIAGEISNFTGISSPYEIPRDADIVLKTQDITAGECAKKIVDYFEVLCTLRETVKDLCCVAKLAGEKISEIYDRGFDVKYKSDSSPLTEADIASDKLICAHLREKYPRFAVLSEESKDDKTRLTCDGCFIVDPLDGTKEFVKRNGEFTVNIALSYLGKTVLGVVYAPVTGRMYCAAKGLGAFAFDSGCKDMLCEENRIRVSEKEELLTVMTSRSHGDEALARLLERNSGKIGKTASVGSSLKGCLIAEGKADIYYRTGFTMEWDTAAMQCIVEEAGGVFMQGDGTPMRYNRENSLNEKGFYILNRIGNKFD